MALICVARCTAANDRSQKHDRSVHDVRPLHRLETVWANFSVFQWINWCMIIGKNLWMPPKLNLVHILNIQRWNIVFIKLDIEKCLYFWKHPQVKGAFIPPTTKPLRESIPRLFNWGSTAMTARCAPACSQVLPVKPQGVWARGIEAWAWSRDRRNWSCGGWGLQGPPA